MPYLFYFMLTWLPFYLVQERHLSMQSMARNAAAYYLTDAVSAIVTGWLSDVWIPGWLYPYPDTQDNNGDWFTIATIAMAAFAARSDTYLP